MALAGIGFVGADAGKADAARRQSVLQLARRGAHRPRRADLRSGAGKWPLGFRCRFRHSQRRVGAACCGRVLIQAVAALGPLAGFLGGLRGLVLGDGRIGYGVQPRQFRRVAVVMRDAGKLGFDRRCLCRQFGQPFALGVAHGDFAVGVAAVAVHPAPFHGRGARAKMLARLGLDAAFFVAAVVNPDIKPGALIGPVFVLFPLLTECGNVGGRGGDTGYFFCDLPPLSFAGLGPHVGDFAETVRA